MSSPPREAAGWAEQTPSIPPVAQPAATEAGQAPPPDTDDALRAPAAATRLAGGAPSGAVPGPSSTMAVRPSNALVELTLDLRLTPPDKVLPRLFGALERIAPDVVLFVLLRDTPEYAGVVASAASALRAQGYVSDCSRLPAGYQRMRVRRRHQEGSAFGAA